LGEEDNVATLVFDKGFGFGGDVYHDGAPDCGSGHVIPKIITLNPVVATQGSWAEAESTAAVEGP
jgi:hypothetical protein